MSCAVATFRACSNSSTVLAAKQVPEQTPEHVSRRVSSQAIDSGNLRPAGNLSDRPVIVAAGGTGGHVVPALAVADVLRSQGVPVVWIGTSSGLEAAMVPAHGIDIHWISISGLRGKSILSMLIAPLKLLVAVHQSASIMIALKPRAVLGMGGFVSGPVGLAAWLLRLPLIVHEQNAIAGMTNRYLSKLASRVFCAFPNAFSSSVDAQWVGNPVLKAMAEHARSHQEITVAEIAGDALDRQAHSELAADKQRSSERQPQASEVRTSTKPHIVIIGGSRGAKILNDVVPDAVAKLSIDVSVLHQAGAGKCASVRQRYAEIADAGSDLSTGMSTGPTVEVRAFIGDMTKVYQSADLVICRSGAMTVTELSALGVPSILVPFPFAVDDHQSVNANYLVEQGAAVLMPQSIFDVDSLAAELEKLLSDRQRLAAMGKAALHCFKADAAQTVATAILEVSR